MSDYSSFIKARHPLYTIYYSDWKMCQDAFHGGTEWKRGRYLRAYSVDFDTPSETINTYNLQNTSNPHKVQTQMLTSGSADKDNNELDGTFYGEKLSNTPLYNYVKLIVGEYNSILFRNPPQRVLGNSDLVHDFVNDVDGEGNSINEFMSQVDMYTTMFGVCHVSCILPLGAITPRFRVHTPLEITNWEYHYDAEGNLVLEKVVICLDDSDDHTVYRLYTDTVLQTYFVAKESEDDYEPPVDDPNLVELEPGLWMIEQPNELGYIPVSTIYQSTKVYNNVGSTVVQDVAQIQRSIYGDLAEIYSAITYSAHPTLVVDESTAALNSGKIGSEPGNMVKVQSSLTGQPTHVYEFKSPELTAISEIRELINDKISRLSQIAMLRSEDLIKASNSGAQIEVFDDKLAAMIRRKATNLENSEFKLWKIWFDWTGMNMPENFAISYNRQYNRRSLEIELKEMSQMMNGLAEYEAAFGAEDTAFKAEMQELIKARLTQLGNSSTTDNGF